MKKDELKRMETADLMEVRAERVARQAELRKLSEERELTEEELTEARSLKYDIEQVSFELDKRNNASNPFGDVVVLTKEERKEPTLVEVLRGLATGRMTAEMEALNERGRSDFAKAGTEVLGGFAVPLTRANEVTATTAGSGKELVGKTTTLLDPLNEELVFAKAGATIQAGLSGNVEFVAGGKLGAEWKGETDPKDAEKLTFESKEFAPKRLSTRVDVSVQLLNQSTAGVEEYIANQMRNAIRAKLESTILGTADIANAPKAFFVNANLTKTKVDASLKDLTTTFVNGLRANDALRGKLAFITSPAGLAMLSATPMGINYLGSLVDYKQGTFLGYNVLTSNGVGTIAGAEGLVFADWSKLFIGNWGGLEITRDPYTRAHEGVVRFVLNTYWDAGFVDDNARVIGAIKEPTKAV